MDLLLFLRWGWRGGLVRVWVMLWGRAVWQWIASVIIDGCNKANLGASLVRKQ